MRLLHPDPAAGLLGLRAMKTFVSAADPMDPSQRVVMEAATCRSTRSGAV
jgi:hypothetical protein